MNTTSGPTAENMASNTGGDLNYAVYGHLGFLGHTPNGSCTKCTDKFHHLCVESGTPKFKAAHKELADYFRCEPQSTIDTLQSTVEALQKHIAELEAEAAELKRSGNSKTAGVKRKSRPDSKRMDIDSAPPSKRTATAALPVVVPHIGFDVVDAEARPNEAVDYTLIEYAHFLPGMHLRTVEFHWNLKTGAIDPPPHIFNLVKAKRLPDARPPAGPTSGAQMFPMSDANLNQIIQNAETLGNWSAVLQLRYMRMLAGLVNYLYSRHPTNIAALAGIAHNILSVHINPPWTAHSIYITPTQFVRPEDSFQAWEQHPTEIPAVASSPGANASLQDLAHAVCVHYSPTTHYGVLTSNNGTFYLPNLEALLLYLQLSPVPNGDKDFKRTLSNFHILIVTLAANFGLYPSIISETNLTINSTHNIIRCTKDDVKDTRALSAHLAACGITVEELNNCVHWALQYCLDIVRLTFFDDELRHRYALIFINAQHRLMFLPLPNLSTATYMVPEHWKMDHICEYRRRCAVVHYWKDSHDPRYIKDTKIPVIRHNALQSPSSDTMGLAAMTLDSEPSQSSDQPVPGPSTST
ncbi:hypothetical protein L218DRAFT_967676 [Marasmius fiardii PR-910]|nr:hypothetical protein L218DRAFT_967676 [Marasmius fiardii PR-910]